ncbi:GntR family transcriptional regulator [Brachybacterium ginsengisoli]|uniref:GntR family transcriptional regulator n=1 Tax=Brachybacterium ginsengisoli TaxID=1331682 RepID=A0A291H1M2_9MICO|nr:FCD domain-containing protein [Brachybacterium ginsengisoli]ATG56290.1 GntR family transcriptional regulator [Brachybacterium ginsengisoli]
MPAPVLHSEVARALGEEIVGGVVPAGHVLTLAGLEERFSRSRTVLREAVRVLESLGLVVSKRRVGVVVQPPEAWSVLSPQVIAWRLGSGAREEQLRSLTQLRRAIEPNAARAAAARRGGDAAGPLLEAAERLQALGERGEGATEAYIEADVAFHAQLLRASGNEMFAALEPSISEVLRGRARLGRNPAWPTPRSLDHHRELARAVAEGRAEEAEAMARAIAGDVLREVAGHEGSPED